MRTCPFCHKAAQTKEHVWPQWLQNYLPYQIMSHGRHGSRYRQTEYVPHQGALTTRQQHVADFLPHVVADVCAACNNGWMAAMEAQVQALIGPQMEALTAADFSLIAQALVGPQTQPASPAELPPLDQSTRTLLATWFSKCVYGYAAATFAEPNRPWSPQQYAALKDRQSPSGTARIWMGRSRGAHADIVLSLAPVSTIPLAAGASLDPGRPSIASAWLSANGIVFYGLWMPAELRATGFPEQLAGPHLKGMTRIWPPMPTIEWPTSYIDDSQVRTLIDLLPDLRDKHGIPVDEMTARQLERLKSAMRKDAVEDGFAPPYAFVRRVLSERTLTDVIEGEVSPWPRHQ